MIRWDDTHADQVAALSDDELLRAYQRATGEPRDQAADALLAEIHRRELGIREPYHPGDSVTKPCVVEAYEGHVVVECGVAGTTLTPAIARDAGKRMIEEADLAERGDGEQRWREPGDQAAAALRAEIERRGLGV